MKTPRFISLPVLLIAFGTIYALAGERQAARVPQSSVGSIRVVTTTTGDTPQPSYIVTVDGIPRKIASNGEVVMERPAFRKVIVTLGNVPPECVLDRRSHEVQVLEKETIDVKFHVECSSRATEAPPSEELQSPEPAHPGEVPSPDSGEATETSLYERLGKYDGIVSIVESIIQDLPTNLRLAHHFPERRVPKPYQKALVDLFCALSAGDDCAIRFTAHPRVVTVTSTYKDVTLAKPILFTVTLPEPERETIYVFNDGTADFAAIEGLDVDTNSWNSGAPTSAEVRRLLGTVHESRGVDESQFDEFIVLVRDALRKQEAARRCKDCPALDRQAQEAFIERIRGLESAVVKSPKS